GAARRGRRVGGELDPDYRRDLDRVLVGRAVEYQARDELLAGVRRVDQQDRVRAREHHSRFELKGLRLGFRAFGDAALPRTVEPRFTSILLIDFAVARLLLIEAIAYPVPRLPSNIA